MNALRRPADQGESLGRRNDDPSSNDLALFFQQTRRVKHIAYSSEFFQRRTTGSAFDGQVKFSHHILLGDYVERI